MSKSEKSFDMELLFRALADRTRLRLLNLMADTEICVCFFVEVLGTNQPKISRHLAYLRRAGVVTARREGKWMHYRITRAPTSTARASLVKCARWLADDNEMHATRSAWSRSAAPAAACPTPRRAPPVSLPRIASRLVIE